MSKAECIICGKEMEWLDEFYEEMMCQECYFEPENRVFE